MAVANYLNAPSGSHHVFQVPVGSSVIPFGVMVEDKRLLLSFRYHEGLKNEVKASLEGAKWDAANKRWTCRNSPRNWYVIADVWMDSAEHNRYWTPPPRVMPARYPLWENQIQGISAWVHRKRFIYAGKMGTGKMLIGFGGVDYLMQKLKTSNIWWTTNDAGFKAFDDLYDEWKPVMYPKVRCTFTGLAKEIDRQSQPPQIWVIDECDNFKTPNTIQTQAAFGLAELSEKMYGDDFYLLMLSGTPDPKDQADWWAQLELMRPGFVRERDIHTFKDRYAYQEEVEVPVHDAEEGKTRKYKKVVAWKRGQTIMIDSTDENGMTVKKSLVLPDECGKFPARLAGAVMRHDERDLPIEVKEKKYIVCSGIRDVEIPNAEVRFNPLLVPDMGMLRLAESITNTSTNALQALSRMRQAADGFQYSDEGTKYGKSQKLAVLKQNLDAHREHGRTIIYAAFTASIDKLVETVRGWGWAVIRVDGRGWEGFECPATIRAFQDRLDHNYPIAYIAHAKKGGAAITLTAADSIHFFSQDFIAKNRWQAELRVRYKACTVYDYLHLPSDVRVYNNLRGKKDGSELTLNELRRLNWIAVGKNPDEEEKKLEAVKVPELEGAVTEDDDE